MSQTFLGYYPRRRLTISGSTSILLYEREPVTQLFVMLRVVTEKQWRLMEIPRVRVQAGPKPRLLLSSSAKTSCACTWPSWKWEIVRYVVLGAHKSSGRSLYYDVRALCSFTGVQEQTSVVAFKDLESTVFLLVVVIAEPSASLTKGLRRTCTMWLLQFCALWRRAQL